MWITNDWSPQTVIFNRSTDSRNIADGNTGPVSSVVAQVRSRAGRREAHLGGNPIRWLLSDL
jgi:hypothetical protein